MARIRSVHPGLFTDEAFVSLTPLARLLLIGLWTEADDQGVFEWKPIALKMRLLPVDDADVPALLGEMAALNVVRGFEHDGKQYGLIRNFRKYQRPKKPNAVHVLPDEFRKYVGLSDDSSESKPAKETPVPQKGEIAPQMEDGGGRVEEVGVGGNSPHPPSGDSPPKRSSKPREAGTPAAKQRGSRLPDGWQPSESLLVWAGTEFPDLDVRRETEKFRDYWVGKPGKDGVKQDWPATWRNWMRRAAEYRPANGQGSAKFGSDEERRKRLVEASREAAEEERRQRAVYGE